MRQISRRHFVKDAVGTGIALSVSSAAPAVTPSQTSPNVRPTDSYALVDPELVPALKALPKVDVNAGNLAADRSAPAPPSLPSPAPQAVSRTIPGPKGAPDVSILVISPPSDLHRRPALLYIHGGGYVSGRAELFVTRMQEVAQKCGCVVVLVNYRLAPETRFPGALEDNYAALRWLYTNSEQLGVDPNRIAVGGESAGGGHSAMLTIAARDRGEIPIVFQLLIYPMLDDRTGSSRRVPPGIGEFVWTSKSNVFGWTSLLGLPAGSEKVPPGSVPARIENLAGLPPAFVGVGSIDLFVDEDVEYARRLIGAGIPTELHVVPGAYHAFDLLVPDATITIRFTGYWMAALKRSLVSS